MIPSGATHPGENPLAHFQNGRIPGSRPVGGPSSCPIFCNSCSGPCSFVTTKSAQDRAPSGIGLTETGDDGNVLFAPFEFVGDEFTVCAMHCIIEQNKVHGICLEHAQSVLAFGSAQYSVSRALQNFVTLVKDCRILTHG